MEPPTLEMGMAGRPDRKFSSDFVLMDQIGSGMAGRVHLCQNKQTLQTFAVKVIDLKRLQLLCRPTTLENTIREAELLKRLRHPHIVEVMDVFVFDHEVHIVMEHLVGGDLFERLMQHGRYSEESTRTVVRQLVGALQFLHRRDIVHRDLKPENILLISALSDTDIKLVDFGLAKVSNSAHTLKTFCGTPQYFAPEILLCQQNLAPGYGKAVDVWSLGIVTFVLLTGRFPFSEDRLSEELVQGRVLFGSDWDDVTPEALAFVRQLLTVDPIRRPTMDDLLLHPWVTNGAPASAPPVTKKPLRLRTPASSLAKALGRPLS